MKACLITEGGVYHDGKLGVREVLAIDGAPLRVTYRILAQKVEHGYKGAELGMMSLIGTESRCDIASFASWARVLVARDERENLLAELSARKLKLPPGEAAFMVSVAREYGSSDFIPVPGSSVSFQGDELRSARGVGKKGLATVGESSLAGAGGLITLTPLGAAWVRLRMASASSTRS
jgi:hypothetical protein